MKQSRVPWSTWSSAFPWAGLAVGPAAWATNTQLNYALLNWSCGRGWSPTPAIAAVLTVISLAAGALSFLVWQRHEGLRISIPEPDGRTQRLLSGIGFAAGVLFAVVIALQGLAALLLGPCLR
jgi:hypothetical protein